MAAPPARARADYDYLIKLLLIGDSGNGSHFFFDSGELMSISCILLYDIFSPKVRPFSLFPVLADSFSPIDLIEFWSGDTLWLDLSSSLIFSCNGRILVSSFACASGSWIHAHSICLWPRIQSPSVRLSLLHSHAFAFLFCFRRKVMDFLCLAVVYYMELGFFYVPLFKLNRQESWSIVIVIVMDKVHWSSKFSLHFPYPLRSFCGCLYVVFLVYHWFSEN